MSAIKRDFSNMMDSNSAEQFSDQDSKKPKLADLGLEIPSLTDILNDDFGLSNSQQNSNNNNNNIPDDVDFPPSPIQTGAFNLGMLLFVLFF